MGAGIYGSFGNSVGNNVRYRIGRPVKPIIKSFEQSINPDSYIESVVKKYNINLRGSGQTITIKYNADIPQYGRIKKSNPRVIEIGKLALVNETELANTIAHELNHARSYLKGGEAPEKTAYASGRKLSKYIGGKI